jgi:hypothetical protein
LPIDTGRGPEEVCALPLDCLACASDGAPVLVHENRKANRRSRESGLYPGSTRSLTRRLVGR